MKEIGAKKNPWWRKLPKPSRRVWFFMLGAAAVCAVAAVLLEMAGVSLVEIDEAGRALPGGGGGKYKAILIGVTGFYVGVFSIVSYRTHKHFIWLALALLTSCFQGFVDPNIVIVGNLALYEIVNLLTMFLMLWFFVMLTGMRKKSFFAFAFVMLSVMLVVRIKNVNVNVNFILVNPVVDFLMGLVLISPLIWFFVALVKSIFSSHGNKQFTVDFLSVYIIFNIGLALIFFVIDTTIFLISGHTSLQFEKLVYTYISLIGSAVYLYIIYAFATDFADNMNNLRELNCVIMQIMADLIESRDATTGGHVQRTSVVFGILADACVKNDMHKKECSEWNKEDILIATQLHDIGKIQISDTILNKPGKLDDIEFAIMKQHAAYGGQIIETIMSRVKDSDFLKKALIIGVTHHEKWDGSGYPKGLSGESIPVEGRLLAVADVYDALRSDRPYKKGFTHEKSVDIIKEGRGTHFDPNLVDIFLNVEKKIEKYYAEEVNFEQPATEPVV